MAEQNKICKNCDKENIGTRYFCSKCGSFLNQDDFSDSKIYELSEMKIMRILDNLNHSPHNQIVWNDVIDLYTRKVEKFKAFFQIPEMGSENQSALCEKMNDFLEICYKPEFQIAFVGTIKTGKSTLINSLLGHNYASMAVTPETAALTKFRSSARDYVHITFYSQKEWDELWASRTSGADTFMNEYHALDAESQRTKWVGHKPIYKEVANSEIESELSIWSSSKKAEHYFVKEIEVGISSLPSDFPKQVVFVDTPGLSDPVAYRSEITKQYIRKANAVFVCVDAQKIQKDEIETISSVFSFSSHNKNKVHIIATHWDKLNNPEKDWSDQKEWMKKKLVGKGFFDTEEMAHKNILYAAAHIYNLCRDYHELSIGDMIPVMQLGLLLGIRPEMEEIRRSLPKLMEISNIDTIKIVISSELVDNYKELLYQDIEKKYLDIVFNLKRIANENKKEIKEVLEVSNSDMKKMEAKVMEHRKNYEEVSQCRTQLIAILNTVDKSTKKRLNTILSKLESLASSGKKDKK